MFCLRRLSYRCSQIFSVEPFGLTHERFIGQEYGRKGRLYEHFFSS